MKTTGTVAFSVRSGLGTVNADGTFSDEIEVSARAPRQHAGWQSVTYKGNRYQLNGGVRTPFFVNLSNPIKPKT